MKTFTNLKSLTAHNSFLGKHIKQHIDQTDYSCEFTWSLGGDVHIAETVEDAQKIFRENPFFDISESVNDSWHILFIANNNAGGPTYFVPRDIIEEVNQIGV